MDFLHDFAVDPGSMYTQVFSFLSYVQCRFNILSQLTLVLHFFLYFFLFHWRLCLASDIADRCPFWKSIQLEESNSPSVDCHHNNSQANQVYTQASFHLQKQNASEHNQSQLDQKQLTWKIEGSRVCVCMYTDIYIVINYV